MRSSSATGSEKMDPAATTTLHPRSFSCESRHYREKKRKQIRWFTHPPSLTKVFIQKYFFIRQKMPPRPTTSLSIFFPYTLFCPPENKFAQVRDCFSYEGFVIHLNFGGTYSKNFHLALHYAQPVSPTPQPPTHYIRSVWVKLNLWKLIQLYAAVCEVCMHSNK